MNWKLPFEQWSVVLRYEFQSVNRRVSGKFFWQFEHWKALVISLLISLPLWAYPAWLFIHRHGQPTRLTAGFQLSRNVHQHSLYQLPKLLVKPQIIFGDRTTSNYRAAPKCHLLMHLESWYLFCTAIDLAHPIILPEKLTSIAEVRRGEELSNTIVIQVALSWRVLCNLMLIEPYLTTSSNNITYLTTIECIVKSLNILTLSCLGETLRGKLMQSNYWNLLKSNVMWLIVDWLEKIWIECRH